MEAPSLQTDVGGVDAVAAASGMDCGETETFEVVVAAVADLTPEVVAAQSSGAVEVESEGAG